LSWQHSFGYQECPSAAAMQANTITAAIARVRTIFSPSVFLTAALRPAHGF
jgi:hypothetical protein